MHKKFEQNQMKNELNELKHIKNLTKLTTAPDQMGAQIMRRAASQGEAVKQTGKRCIRVTYIHN